MQRSTARAPRPNLGSYRPRGCWLVSSSCISVLCSSNTPAAGQGCRAILVTFTAPLRTQSLEDWSARVHRWQAHTKCNCAIKKRLARSAALQPCEDTGRHVGIISIIPPPLSHSSLDSCELPYSRVQVPYRSILTTDARKLFVIRAILVSR